jgi:hypothetical protein
MCVSPAQTLPSNTPRALFGDAGLPFVDPFISIPIVGYTRREFNMLMDFYAHLNWIQHKECMFLGQLF